MQALAMMFGVIIGSIFSFLSFFLIFLPLSKSFPSNPEKLFSAGGMLNLGLLASFLIGISAVWLIFQGIEKIEMIKEKSQT